MTHNFNFVSNRPRTLRRFNLQKVNAPLLRRRHIRQIKDPQLYERTREREKALLPALALHAIKAGRYVRESRDLRPAAGRIVDMLTVSKRPQRRPSKGIAHGLECRLTFAQLATMHGRAVSTIANEVKNRMRRSNRNYGCTNAVREHFETCSKTYRNADGRRIPFKSQRAHRLQVHVLGAPRHRTLRPRPGLQPPQEKDRPVNGLKPRAGLADR